MADAGVSQVAGSYENEVLAVSMLVSAIKHIAAHASPHNHVELDVHTASGALALSFMDGKSPRESGAACGTGIE